MNYYGGGDVFERLTQSAISKIRNMTDEQLERFGELMMKKGTPSAGIRSGGYADILGKQAELEQEAIAKYGIAGAQFGEKQRQFDIELGEKQRQFDIGTKLKEKELSLFEQQMADLEDARKKEAKNWWKKYLGQALGMGLGIALPGSGTAIGTGIGLLGSGSGDEISGLDDIYGMGNLGTTSFPSINPFR